MASRYGSMKQIQSFGPSGETIMDYSIYDAMQAGFKKIVFISDTLLIHSLSQSQATRVPCNNLIFLTGKPFYMGLPVEAKKWLSIKFWIRNRKAAKILWRSEI